MNENEKEIKIPTCTCDAFVDDPCPKHKTENELQNRALEWEQVEKKLKNTDGFGCGSLICYAEKVQNEKALMVEREKVKERDNEIKRLEGERDQTYFDMVKYSNELAEEKEKVSELKKELDECRKGSHLEYTDHCNTKSRCADAESRLKKLGKKVRQHIGIGLLDENYQDRITHDELRKEVEGK